MKSPLLDRLLEGPVVADGAMGTYLHELGYDIHHGAEPLVLSNADAVRRVHAAYVDAGAELIESDTFAANRLALAATGKPPDVRALNATAVKLAREAAAGRAWVAGSIGPVIPHVDEPLTAAEINALYAEQIEGLCEGGADALLFETFERLDGLLAALAVGHKIAGSRLPLMAQLVFADGHAASGEAAFEAARQLINAGARVVGANCGRGLQSIRQALDGLLQATAGTAFVSAYPNAGYPELFGGRTVYLGTPLHIARQAAEWAQRGVRLIGGCCGTTPETIRAISQALSSLRKTPRLPAQPIKTAPQATAPIVASPTVAATTAPTPHPPATAGGFLESIANIKLPIIAELDPPPHLDWQPWSNGVRALLTAGANAISLAENPLASVRMENTFLAAWLRRVTGGQVICHMTCRDRNSLALQSALMAAYAANIEAILAVTGDPVQRGGHQRVMSVYEQTSVGLVRLIANLNAGRTAVGRDLKGKTNFSIGVAFNSAAANLEAETAKLRRKRDEGARFVMTQPVFDYDQARRVLDHATLDSLRLFLGFMPPVTLKLALYLHNEVPGIRLAEPLLEKLAHFDQPEDQQRMALEWTNNLLQELRAELQGVYLITPGARWRALLPLLEGITQS